MTYAVEDFDAVIADQRRLIVKAQAALEDVIEVGVALHYEQCLVDLKIGLARLLERRQEAKLAVAA